MTTVLQVTDAEKRFGETTALAGATLSLERGEWLGLLGPNGAGKTTLVRAIAGRVRLDGGAISLLERTLDGTGADAEGHRRLGIVPQELALYPLLTATENLRTFGALHGVRGRLLRERVAWALDWTGLGDRDREPVKRFSGGMKRRLNIACGVLHEPEVVLLDEPTVGVDPQSRHRIWEMLGELRQRGAALLLTTHQLDEAQQVCERIVIIDHGRAIADGSFAELLEATIGTGRQVTFVRDGAEPVTHTADDLARDLPRLLASAADTGATVTDVRIEAPSLQSVFIHLTGRELRE
ncbi:MAG: ABC transporter ATP-binding protein [Planctomycetes bacterium]|nr:ABC transporter ATP-binding protein [Planctomycetota bacterium]